MRFVAAFGLALAVGGAPACSDPGSEEGSSAAPAGSGTDGPIGSSETAAAIAIAAGPVLRDCNGRPDDGDEARLGTDAHCGACDRACGAGERCVGEVCLSTADLAMSGTHTCALGATGRVHCWGANEAGEVGDGTRLTRDRPVPVHGVDDAVQLAVRDRETCVRRRSGVVACWGEAFGTGRPGTVHLEPTEVPALRGATDLALANDVLCGIVPGRGIVCLPWGSSDAVLREIGPPPGAAVDDAIDLAAIPRELCAARRDGSVVCWTLRPQRDLPREALQAPVEGVRGALTLVSSGETVCALRAGNLAACWGGGIVTTQGVMRDDFVAGVHDFGALGPVTDLAFLGWPSDEDCATRVDGTTLCWPQPYIELARRAEPRQVKSRAMPVPAATHVDSVKRDASHCVLTREGEPYCWGELAAGRLGVGRPPDQWSPRPIEGLTGVREIVASEHRACARMKAGALRCWGGGHEPRDVKLDGLDRVLSGRCASVRGELVCYADLFTEPLPASGVRDAAQLVPAAQGSNIVSYFVRHTDGTVSRVEWKLDGRSWSLVSAARVRGLTGVKELLSVDRHTCVRDGAAGLACWASLGDATPDAEGQLAVERVKGTLPEGLTSVRLTRVDDDGRSEGCGTRASDVVCWDGTKESAIPLPGVRRFDVSPNGVRCALMADSVLRCWGDQADAYTGHGTRARVDAPTPVPGLTGVAGFAFAQRSWNEDDAVFVWLRDGRVFSWGHDGGRWGDREAGVLGWTAPRRLEVPTKVELPPPAP